MSDQQEEEDNKKIGMTDYLRLVFTAQADAHLFLLKTILLLNSGALVFTLISIVRSESNDISSVLAEASSFFGYGLTLSFVGVLSHSSHSYEIGEGQEYLEKHKITLIVHALAILSSIVFFLYGVWYIIGGIKEILRPL